MLIICDGVIIICDGVIGIPIICDGVIGIPINDRKIVKIEHKLYKISFHYTIMVASIRNVSVHNFLVTALSPPFTDSFSSSYDISDIVF